MEGAAAAPDACREVDLPAVALAPPPPAHDEEDPKIGGAKENQLLGGGDDQGAGGPESPWRARRTSSSSSSSSSSSTEDVAGKGPSSAEAAADVATACLAALLPSPRRLGARPPLPPPSPVDAAALVLASAAAAATEQRQRRRRRRRHEARKQQQQQQQQQAAFGGGGFAALSSWWCPRPLASLARAAPLLAAAALIGALVPAFIAPEGSVVRQRWAPESAPPSPVSVRLGSTVVRVDGAAGALELAFSAAVSGVASDAVASADGAAARLVVGVGPYAALEIDLPTTGQQKEERQQQQQQPQRHTFAARVPMLPSAAVATARTGAAYATPSQLPFPFDEWSSVVQVWAALERCGGAQGGSSDGPLPSLYPSSCSRTPVPLEWAASLSSRSWRARVSATQVVVVGHNERPGASGDPSAGAADAVALAQLRVSLSRPAPARVLALLEMSARWLLGGYAALATANWVVAALVIGPLPRGRAFGAADDGAGAGVGAAVGSSAEEIFSTLD